MMRSYQILVGLALISATSLRTRLANISYQTRTFFPLTLLKSLPPPSFKRVAGTSHFVLFKGADCGEKTPCLQIQMFKKNKKPPRCTLQQQRAAALPIMHSPAISGKPKWRTCWGKMSRLLFSDGRTNLAGFPDALSE